MNFIKKIILIFIILISIINFNSGNYNYVNKNKIENHLIFNEDLFLISLVTYFYYNEKEFVDQIKHLYYKDRILNYFHYINKNYKYEIDNINKIFYGKNYLSLKNKKGKIKLKKLSGYFTLVCPKIDSITLRIPEIKKFFEKIKNDKVYINLIKFIKNDAISFFLKEYKSLNKFLKNNYSTEINLKNTKIYYLIFYNNIFSLYPLSYTEHKYKYSIIWVSNIYDYSFIIELMHILYNKKFYLKVGDKYIKKYNSNHIFKKLFDFEFKNKNIIKNNFDDIFAATQDYMIFYDTNRLYDELFSNLFYFYYLKQTNKIRDYFYRKSEIFSLIYFNLLKFRSFGYYCYKFFPEYKGKNIIKDFIKYVYNLKFKDIKEANKNINIPVKTMVKDKTNCYFINNFKDDKGNKISNTFLLEHLQYIEEYNNIKILNIFDKITYGINVLKLEKGIYKVRPKLIILCSLNYPEFKDIASLDFLSKYKSRQYFLKLKNMYNNNEIENLDYAILSYLDSMIFIYFRNIKQINEILNKLSSIDSDHYFKYK